ncbi:MAG TPA: 2-dehydropantoate 2-reductase, partial [Burkholderiaceae bacterium]|nr:2-dehydropantoate 2-reductase [Burkholderiaceae bacterium]
MKIAVIGAGAIGGMLAVRLALSGHAVTVVARGAHLEAIRMNGLKLVHPDGAEEVAPDLRAVASCADAGLQDLVLLAVKAYAIEGVAPQMRALFGDDTLVVTLQNGLPWWYFQNFTGPHAGYRLKSADPNGVIEQHIEARRIIGCVVYPAGEIVAPGVVKRVEGNRFPVGELDGIESARVIKVSEALVGAGLKAPILNDIRSEIWLKLWGNMSFNPISALTQATLVDICQEPTTRKLAADMMRETQAIAEKLGVTFRVPLDKRIEGAEKIGKHKTSTLQDVQAGRAVEVDALIGSVIELSELTDTPAPASRAVHALLKLLVATMHEQRA